MVIWHCWQGSVFSSDLYYRKTGILYDHIADIEHNYIRVWISGFYERGKYLKYLQCNCFSFSITTLICLNGIHRKTWASVISTICVLFLIMALFEFSIQFFGDLDYSNLEYLGSMSNSADIFWTDIMLTGLGAIMDVAVTISAATGEIVRKNPDVSLTKLIHSGREIGYDIMGTMINVLLFVLASGMIPMFILKMNNEIRFITIIRYHIPYDICRFLIESIGIVLAIPVSVFISSIIMKLPSLKRSDKK